MGKVKVPQARLDRAETHMRRVTAGVTDRSPWDWYADFRGRLTCLIDTQVARMTARDRASALSAEEGLDRGASRAHETHRPTSQPRHGVRRLSQARLFQQRVVG
jgi:hypothetical protein